MQKILIAGSHADHAGVSLRSSHRLAKALLTVLVPYLVAAVALFALHEQWWR